MNAAEQELNPVVEQYEVFRNDEDALSFFMEKNPILDKADPKGPFFFTSHQNGIIAGAADAQVILPNVPTEIIELARKRKVITLVEFEDKKPVRVMPCYLAPDLE